MTFQEYYFITWQVIGMIISRNLFFVLIALPFAVILTKIFKMQI